MTDDDGRPSSEPTDSPSEPPSDPANPSPESPAGSESAPGESNGNPTDSLSPSTERDNNEDATVQDVSAETDTKSTTDTNTDALTPSDRAARPTTHHVDDTADSPESLREWISWFRTTETGPAMVVRELLSSIVLVAAVGLFLFAISGVWPPMVAVQSGSMNPHMHKGDLVFIVDEHRFAPGDKAVDGTGVVTLEKATKSSYSKFGAPGDVIIYEPDGSNFEDPIIHRAHFWVEEGENWYAKANKSYVTAQNCGELTYCPAPNSGFITKGDNPSTNTEYDQAQAMTRPVKPAWIKGKAMVRIPGLGWIRLKFGSITAGSHALAGAAGLGLFVGRRRMLA